MDYYSILALNWYEYKRQRIYLSYNFHNISRCVYRDDYEKAPSQLVHVEILNDVLYVEPSTTFGIGVFKREQRSGNHIKFLARQRGRQGFCDSADRVSIYNPS